MPPDDISSESLPMGVDLVLEALLILSIKEPRLATVYYSHKVERFSLTEIAGACQKHVRTVRGWLNGYTRHDKVYVWGAKDWLVHILDSLIEAHHLGRYPEANFALVFAMGRNPWKEPIPRIILHAFGEAMEAGVFKELLDALKSCLRDKAYSLAIGSLAQIVEEEKLHDWLELLEGGHVSEAEQVLRVYGCTAAVRHFLRGIADEELRQRLRDLLDP